jgi:hypothetical protein
MADETTCHCVTFFTSFFTLCIKTRTSLGLVTLRVTNILKQYTFICILNGLYHEICNYLHFFILHQHKLGL